MAKKPHTLRAAEVLKEHPTASLRELAEKYELPLTTLRHVNSNYKLGEKRFRLYASQRLDAARRYLLENPHKSRKVVAQMFDVHVSSISEIRRNLELPPILHWVKGTNPVIFTMKKLSERETEVARLISEGYANLNIGAVLDISEETVKRHVTNIFAKVGCASRVQLAVLYVTLKHQHEIAEMKNKLALEQKIGIHARKKDMMLVAG